MKYSFNPFSLVDAPSSCALLFVHGCNYSCKYCYNIDLFNTKEGLSLDEVYEKIDSLQKESVTGNTYNSVDWLIITGGEPTLDPNLKEIIEFAKNQKLKIGLYTNGINDSLVNDLLKNNLLDLLNIDFKHPDLNQIMINEVDEQNCLVSYAERIQALIEDALRYYCKLSLDYLYINTVICKEFHTNSDLKFLRTFINKCIPAKYKRANEKLGWILTPFFNDYDKISTLGNLKYENNKISIDEIQNLLI